MIEVMRGEMWKNRGARQERTNGSTLQKSQELNEKHSTDKYADK